MVNKTISIPQEINNQLKQESNASALITKLLMDHYKYNIKSPDAAIKLIEEKKAKLIEDLDKEKSKLIEIQTKQEELESTELALVTVKQDKRNLTISNCIANCKDLFDVDINITQAEEYLDGDYDSIAVYLDAVNIKPLEIDNEEDSKK